MSDIVPSDTPQFKQCNRCKQSLPISCFTRDKEKRDGLRTICRECTKTKPQPLSPVPDGYKRCRTCGVVKPATIDFFNKTALYQSPDGLNKQCIECRKTYRKTLAQGKPLNANPQEPMKICRDCGQSFPATRNFFSLNRARKDRLSVFCRECNKSRLKTYRSAPNGIEKRLAYRETRRETDKIYHKNYHQRHSERERVYRRIYRATHQEHIRQYAKRYRQTHAHEKRVQTLTRIARKKQAPGSYTAQQIRDLYQRQHGCCYYCKTKFGKGKNAYHMDHIVPLSRGGTNDIHNIVLACPPCNLKKGGKLLHEWIEGGRLL